MSLRERAVKSAARVARASPGVVRARHGGELLQSPVATLVQIGVVAAVHDVARQSYRMTRRCRSALLTTSRTESPHWHRQHDHWHAVADRRRVWSCLRAFVAFSILLPCSLNTQALSQTRNLSKALRAFKYGPQTTPQPVQPASHTAVSSAPVCSTHARVSTLPPRATEIQPFQPGAAAAAKRRRNSNHGRRLRDGRGGVRKHGGGDAGRAGRGQKQPARARRGADRLGAPFLRPPPPADIASRAIAFQGCPSTCTRAIPYPVIRGAMGPGRQQTTGAYCTVVRFDGRGPVRVCSLPRLHALLFCASAA